MAEELLRSRHAFGALENVLEAINSEKVDAYDILFLKDANDKPYIGWVDKNNNPVIIKEDEEVLLVEALPESGETGKIYILEENGYFWNGEKFVNLCTPTDVSALESQVAELETEMEEKVNATTVQNMIEEYTNSVIEVVEF